MITEDYVSFEIAKLLKEKGFDDFTCHSYFYTNGDIEEETRYEGDFGRPTLQMAMKWLREEKDLYVMPQILSDGTYIGYIYRTDGFGLIGHDKRRVRNNPEEACESAIRYCLEELI